VLGVSDACIAVYPGDFAVALAAFDAQVDVQGPRGERTIALNELHREPGTTPHIETVLAPDELILRIRVAATPLGRASTYHKIRDRESYAFALASAAVALRMEGDTVGDARIALGGVATRPWRAREAEQALIGRPLTEGAARAAGDIALSPARPGRQNRFKIELGARTVADALMIAKQRA
jgi:xanthine dehydrogenase YagS FAD-binding subunit